MVLFNSIENSTLSQVYFSIGQFETIFRGEKGQGAGEGERGKKEEIKTGRKEEESEKERKEVPTLEIRDAVHWQKGGREQREMRNGKKMRKQRKKR